jgi:hypothetical protein
VFPAEAVDPSKGTDCFCFGGLELTLERQGFISPPLLARLAGMVAYHTIANVFYQYGKPAVPFLKDFLLPHVRTVTGKPETPADRRAFWLAISASCFRNFSSSARPPAPAPPKP